MEQLETFIRTLIERMGFSEYKIEIDAEHHHGSIVVYNHPGIFTEQLPAIVDAVNHLVQVLAQKSGAKPVIFDVNNYRKEREKLLVELARAAARKVVATKEPVSLPAMNSYERRIIHVELAAHPDVATESEGEGKGRYIAVRPVGAAPRNKPSESSETSS